MGRKVDLYRQKLQILKYWDDFLLQESGLPGKRANLELLQVVVELGNEEEFRRYLQIPIAQSMTGSREEFLVMCGVVGLGKMAAIGNATLEELRPFASDERWRIREAVAMALQYYGRSNMVALLDELDRWSTASLLEQRAAAAGLCEPDLLTNPKYADRTVEILDRCTKAIAESSKRKVDEFRILRQALGYCWSVAVVAMPVEGCKAMEEWLACDDPDVRWVMKENLNKKRLAKALPHWTSRWRERITETGSS